MRAFIMLSTLLAALLLACHEARGQAFVNPNQIAGDWRFTNTNAEIVAFLAEDDVAFSIDARSQGPTGLSASTYERSPDGRAGSYELTVESSDAGIAYQLRSSWSRGLIYYRWTWLVSEPVHREPTPDVRLDFAECAALLRIPLPPGAHSVHVTARRATLQVSRPTEPLVRMIVPGDGEPSTVTVRWQMGSDPELDIMSFEKSFDVVPNCDDVLMLDCSGAGGDAAGIGAIAGRLDVIGHDEWPETRLEALAGPWGNFRHGRIRSDPGEGPFHLPNLVASDAVLPPAGYGLLAYTRIGTPDRFQWLRMGAPDRVMVEGGRVTDLGDVFVLEPARIHGDVLAAFPPPDPVAGSPFDHVIHESHDPASDARAEEPERTRVTMEAGYPWTATCELTGDVVSLAEEWRGDYALLLGGPGSAPSTWSLPEWRMHFGQAGTLETQVSAIIDVVPALTAAITVGPLDDVEWPLHACWGVVELDVIANAGTFVNPEVAIGGSLHGRDFEQRFVSRGVKGTAYGSVHSSQTWGRIRLPLPEGHYVLRPTVHAVNPGGGYSIVDVIPVTLDVGCRQVLRAQSDLLVELDPLPPCRETGTLHVRGGVSSTRDVASVIVRIDGAADVVACTPCGADPSFDVVVDAAADASVQIIATDVAGALATAQGFTRRAIEPSALDLRPASPPLRVARAAGRLRIELEPGVPANVYRGTIGSLRDGRYDHAGIGACGVDGIVEIDAVAGASYFLAAGDCGWGDGSVGRDSRGTERPPALERCP